METLAKVKKLEPVVEGQSANGNDWSKQTVVFETPEGKTLAVEFFGDRRTEKTKKLKVGQLCNVVWVPESHQYEDKWFSKLVGLKLSVYEKADAVIEEE